MQSFEFKPALMRGRDHWTLDSGMVTRNGEPFCNLSMIDRARFGELKSSRAYASWLDLYDGKRRYRIACNLKRSTEDNDTFMAFARAVLEECDKTNPDVKVAIGVGSNVRWAMFVMGVLMVVAAVAFLIATFAMDGAMKDLPAALLFAALFGGMGGVLTYNFAPWTPSTSLSPSEASAYIAALSVD